MLTSEEPSLSNSAPSVKIILIVEDNPTLGELFREIIVQETPHTALLVANSDKALEIVQQVKPHLLIIGYHLTHCTGIELYDQLRAIDELEYVPALICTASLEKHQQEIEQHHLIALCKPFHLDVFLQTIETHLERM